MIRGLQAPINEGQIVAKSTDFVAIGYRVMGTGDRRPISIEVTMREQSETAVNTLTWASKESIGQRLPVTAIERVRVVIR